MTRRGINQVASVHQRLLNLAKSRGRPFNELLQFYAIERFLYRLAESPYRDRLVLKGALMLMVWETPTTRPTRDIDLLGRISNDLDSVRSIVAEICRAKVDDDGLVFDPASATAEKITEDADYEGVRVKFHGQLGKARIAMQIDIGFSDVVTPEPVSINYPAMLGQGSAKLLAYNRETTIAEKFEAMVSLGQINSRMKDFFDLWLLARTQDFKGAVVAEAISRTFAHRHTQVVATPGLSSRRVCRRLRESGAMGRVPEERATERCPGEFQRGSCHNSEFPSTSDRSGGSQQAFFGELARARSMGGRVTHSVIQNIRG
jgi:hypothetical protein